MDLEQAKDIYSEGLAVGAELYRRRIEALERQLTETRERERNLEEALRVYALYALRNPPVQASEESK